MQRRNLFLLILLLSLVFILTLGAATWAAPVSQPEGKLMTAASEPAAKAGYLGSATCRGCHNTIHTSLQETLHPWKVRPKAEATIIGQFPAVVNNVTYTLEQVDWVIGAQPKWKQRYIDILPDGKWQVLPIQWNKEMARWETYNAPAKDYRDACAGCHTTGYNTTDKTWADPGITCEACHGPGQQHVAGGFVNPPGQRGVYAKPDAEVCGACHLRGKSKDGQWDWPEGYVPGGAVHVSDVYSPTTATSAWWFDNPDDAADPGHAKEHRQQYLEWQRSGHSTALSNVKDLPFFQNSCLKCHSEDYRRDNTLTKQTAEFGVTCQTCHLSHEKGDYEGQLRDEAYDLCAECHTGEPPAGGDFAAGQNVHHPMKEMFEGTGFPGLPDMPSPHFQADAGATCNSCHMPGTGKSANVGDIASHLMSLVEPADAKPGEPDSCSGCHTDSTKAILQNVIDTRQAEIVQELADLKALGAANNCGDFDGNAPAEGASDACKLAFTGYKMVHEEGSFGMHNYFYAKAILKASATGLGQAVYDLPYAGSLTCAACHGNYYNTLQDTIHPWKVRPKAEATIIGQWPVEWNGVTYTLDQVDWVIGARAKWKQRYVDIQPDGKWAILPFQWNVATNALAAYTNANDYRNACAGCHTTGYDVDVREWSEPGITCESCHGPGQAHVLAPDKATNPMIYASVDSEVCGACHTRGKTKDGKYDWPEGYVPGGDVHVSDVYSPTKATTAWWYDNPADPNDPGHAKEHRQQYLEWQRSKHSQALASLNTSGHAADFCLACHSEDYRRDPENVTVATAQFTIECVTCHTTHEPGVAGTSQLLQPQYELCVQCHNGTSGGAHPITIGSDVHEPMQEMYEGRGMPEVAENPSSHFQATDGDGGPVCSSCHLPKTGKSGVISNWPSGLVKTGDIASHLLTPVEPSHAKTGEPSSCSLCHDMPAAGLQGVIDARQAETATKLETLAQKLIKLGDPANPSDDVKFAHTAYAFVNADGSLGVHNYPYAQAILDTALGKVNPYRHVYMPILRK